MTPRKAVALDVVADAIAADRGEGGAASLLDARGQLPRDLAIEWWPIAKARPWPDNPRIPGEAVADVVTSLGAFGWQQPLVVDRDGFIVVGHTRRLAAIQMRQTHVPVYVAKRLTSDQAAAYRLLDNKSHERAEWDFPKLTLSLQALRSVGVDMALTGFRPPELSALLDPLPPPRGGEYDESAADNVKMATCPECGARFPK